MKTIEEIRAKNPLWGTSKSRKRPPWLEQQEILEFQEYKCDRCGCELDATNTEFDHIVPYSIVPNRWVVATCRSCNQKKGAKVIVDAIDC
jgi:5-methylcytosine-specific restriction endonuclease McrA